MTDYLSLRINAVSARSKFGAMMLDWFRCNNWRRWTLASWAESAGFSSIPYGLMPDIFHGTAGELKREHFEAIGEANRRLAARDYGNFANYRDMESIHNAVPLIHESGAPWTASDFWACYCGLLAPVQPMTRD
ncbi:MAG: hypothetical protein RLZZ611_290 [Cyanobacteriota bacterium]|jgi:hypothetical protein